MQERLDPRLFIIHNPWHINFSTSIRSKRHHHLRHHCGIDESDAGARRLTAASTGVISTTGKTRKKFSLDCQSSLHSDKLDGVLIFIIPPPSLKPLHAVPRFSLRKKKDHPPTPPFHDCRVSSSFLNSLSALQQKKSKEGKQRLDTPPKPERKENQYVSSTAAASPEVFVIRYPSHLHSSR